MENEAEIMTKKSIGTKLSTLNIEDQGKLESLEKKAVQLRFVLEKDFKAADLKWSLFVAAAYTFRFDSCLKPFPPAFIKNGMKDMDHLIHLIGETPPLDLILLQLDNLDSLANMAELLDLLFFVLVKSRELHLKTVPAEEHPLILQKVNSTAPAAKPQYIFEVVSTTKCHAENRWRELFSKTQDTFYAFHGSRLENFHSILHYGLQQHMTKNMLFGCGIYLSSELSVSLPYSHGGFGWGASCLGSHLSCVAMCEVINDPEGINHQKPTNEGDIAKAKEITKNSSSKVPHTYYVVTNNDLVRIRYLLIYAKQPARYNQFPHHGINNSDSGLRQWFKQHKLLSILLGYGLMLATIGFANNQPAQYYYKMLLKKIELALNSIKT